MGEVERVPLRTRWDGRLKRSSWDRIRVPDSLSSLTDKSKSIDALRERISTRDIRSLRTRGTQSSEIFSESKIKSRSRSSRIWSSEEGEADDASCRYRLERSFVKAIEDEFQWLLKRRFTEPEPPRSQRRSRAERTVKRVLVQPRKVPRLDLARMKNWK